MFLCLLRVGVPHFWPLVEFEAERAARRAEHLVGVERTVRRLPSRQGGEIGDEGGPCRGRLHRRREDR